MSAREFRVPTDSTFMRPFTVRAELVRVAGSLETARSPQVQQLNPEYISI